MPVRWIRCGTIILCIVMAIAVSHVAWSQNNISRFVEGQGVAPIIDQDVSIARETAIFAAKQQVLETLGPRIDSETIYSMGLKIADWYAIKWGGYVKDYEILDEGKDGGCYRVKIRAWVKSGDEAEDVTKNLLSIRKILIISQGKGSEIIEAHLAEKLSTLGYRYHDSAYLRNNLKKATWSRLCHRQLGQAGNDVMRFMADLVIHVKSDMAFRRHDATLNCDWYSAGGEIRLYRLTGEKAGESIIDIQYHSNKIAGSATAGLDSDEVLTTDHPNGFRRQVAHPLVEEFLGRLKENEVFQVREIMVTMRGLPSEREYRSFYDAVRHARGVDGRVEECSREGATYTLRVIFPEKTVYLGYLLAVNRNYRLVGYRWNEIEMAYVQ